MAGENYDEINDSIEALREIQVPKGPSDDDLKIKYFGGGTSSTEGQKSVLPTFNNSSEGIDRFLQEHVIPEKSLSPVKAAPIIEQKDLSYNELPNFNIAENIQAVASKDDIGITLIFDQNTETGVPSAVHFKVGREEDNDNIILTATDEQTGDMNRLEEILRKMGALNEGYVIEGQSFTIPMQDANTRLHSNFFDSNYTTILLGDLKTNAATLKSLENGVPNADVAPPLEKANTLTIQHSP